MCHESNHRCCNFTGPLRPTKSPWPTWCDGSHPLKELRPESQQAKATDSRRTPGDFGRSGAQRNTGTSFGERCHTVLPLITFVHFQLVKLPNFGKS